MAAEIPSTRVPRYSIVALLVGFALFHVTMSIFWQFGAIYLFTGIGEEALVLIGLVGGLPILAGLAMVNVWGALSDRWHRRKPILILGFMAQAASFTAYLFVADTMTFLIVTCLANLFTAAVLPMGNAYLTETQTQKGGAVGLLLGVSSFGWFFGAIGGGFLYDIVGMPGLFQVGAITSLIGGLVILSLVREVPSLPLVDTGVSTSPTELMSTVPTSLPISRRRFLLILCVVVGLGNIGTNSFSAFFGIYFLAEIGGTAAMLGIANGAASLAGLGVTLAAGGASDRFGRKPMILFGFTCYSFFWLIYMTIIDPWIAMWLWMIPFYPLILTAGFSAAADVSEVAYRGRAMTFVTTAQQIGAGIGPIIGGALTQFVTITVRGNLLLAATLNAVSLFIVLLLLPETLRSIKQQPTQSPGTPSY